MSYDGRLKASPRSRGWTRAARGDRPAAGGFPALAGMDPDDLAGRAHRGRLPRARGDGPVPAFSRDHPVEASPRSRGWTLYRRALQIRSHGFPALAGMDPSRSTPHRRRCRLPRARGDGPARATAAPISSTASPRSRGWTQRRPAGAAARRGFPALAGMDPPSAPAGYACPRLPRARGDGPRCDGVTFGIRRASPRSRGWTPVGVPVRAAALGFPALAGMDPSRGRSSTTGGRLPRARGDGPDTDAITLRKLTASPRSRGWTPRDRGHRRHVPGFPALAGMDPG